ncbi:hypothetical protein Pcac1_g4367 [Phytophthora cactorum]|uniref:FYVE-type domain-containing protein n=1 Tax=Phytophthora cactorum TaxID=29920 RepID=A0A329RLE7_9STRA|nr:hypothetical protein Pcac1_g4367 [Phytophthora cactorum]KAG2804994.1 hypothetical protein PC112_g18461 [Phytophthora cactorum]RAW24516.1 hypothetical protein PC110_g19047 [Phytophthora cactorum]
MPPSKNVIVMPTLELERYDEKMMQELAATLLQQNLDQYSELAVTPDGHPDSRSWASIQKREGVRVYKESSRQQQQQIKAQAATGNSAVKTAKVPPSLLLMGTIKGNLDDVLYATAASSTEAMLTKSKYTDDGVVDAKVLARIIEPTMADPMHFLNVTWRYYALSEPRDYVCLDVAGWGNTARGEQVAYHLIHSVGFDALPSYEHKGIARANLSVCWIFRQRTATLVECYARGYYDFDTTNAMLNSLSMHTIASQWLSCVKLVSYAQSLKLSRLLNCGKGTVSSDGSESDSGDGGFGSYGNNSNPLQSQTMSSSTSSSSSSVVLLPAPPEPARVPASRCKLCCKSFHFLGASRRVCQACDEDVCSRCSVKQTLCLFSRTRQCVQERKKHFCKQCVADAMRSEAGAVARDDFIAATQGQPSW